CEGYKCVYLTYKRKKREQELQLPKEKKRKGSIFSDLRFLFDRRHRRLSRSRNFSSFLLCLSRTLCFLCLCLSAILQNSSFLFPTCAVTVSFRISMSTVCESLSCSIGTLLRFNAPSCRSGVNG